MLTIKNKFGIEIGYSDHTEGIEVPIAAVALGASVIEKHFTLDKTMEGPDHMASLEPSELKAMVIAIRNVEKALGSVDKVPSESEKKNIDIARKSIHLRTFLNGGTQIEKNHLIMKRPGDGISPMVYNELIGKKVKSDLEADHKLSWEDLL
jgi:sialic acid synthase SpsE